MFAGMECCFEFGSGIRVSHHPEGNVSGCSEVETGKERGNKGSRIKLPNVSSTP